MTWPLNLANRLVSELGVSARTLEDLAELHQRQWNLEDQVRDRRYSDPQIADLKRQIDDSNTARHKMIDAIDDQCAPQSFEGNQRRYSETIGELCDRLIILHLKFLAVAERRPELLALAQVAQLQSHYASFVDQLLRDVADKNAALPPRFGLKMYGL